MKAIFIYNEEKTTIEVPLWMHHLSQLSNRLATLTMDSLLEDFISGELKDEHDDETKAYEFLQEELAKVIGEHLNYDANKLHIEFYVASDDLEKEFGVLIGVMTHDQIDEELKNSIPT